MKRYKLQNLREYTTYSSNWGRFVVRPFSDRMLWIVANYTNLTPNEITIIGFLIGLFSAWCFLQGTYIYLILGAFLFELSYAIDCIDGALARLKGIETDFGMYLDNMLDLSKISFAILCLVYGQYALTKDILYFILGYFYLYVSIITFVQCLEIEKIEGKKMKTKTMQSQNSTFKINTYVETKNRVYSIATYSMRNFYYKVRTYSNSKKISVFPAPNDIHALIFFIAPILLGIGLSFFKLALLVGSIALLIILFIGTSYFLNFDKYNETK